MWSVLASSDMRIEGLLQGLLKEALLQRRERQKSFRSYIILVLLLIQYYNKITLSVLLV